ncbi:hypothetical protein FRACA_10042 [Frankia canadensis]|uniref:Isochorismatase-like domain-containing protein n=1 Tax=Frankia canadensis TaxID=1836972 RepID=A0A2I2KI06_9ACTN|nr:isochorismatase family protein [Frankia canadensis]SNQ45283.1 hypothetical protein FRACA_10042 [Frankia canadensis]SOU52573.1 hypothetical protein FRACA_10042 [Frankia canadensis]
MARSRALLMLDLSSQTTRPDGSFGQLISPPSVLDDVVEPLRHALAAARSAADTVVWVLPSPDFIRLMSGRDAAERDASPDPLIGVPGPGEPLALKDGIGAFAGGQLQAELERAGVEEIVLVGIATQYVVRATAEEGLALGYRVSVLEDCCVDLTPQVHAQTIDALRSSCRVATSAEFWTYTAASEP